MYPVDLTGKNLEDIREDMITQEIIIKSRK